MLLSTGNINRSINLLFFTNQHVLSIGEFPFTFSICLSLAVSFPILQKTKPNTILIYECIKKQKSKGFLYEGLIVDIINTYNKKIQLNVLYLSANYLSWLHCQDDFPKGSSILYVAETC